MQTASSCLNDLSALRQCMLCRTGLTATLMGLAPRAGIATDWVSAVELMGDGSCFFNPQKHHLRHSNQSFLFCRHSSSWCRSSRRPTQLCWAGASMEASCTRAWPIRKCSCTGRHPSGQPLLTAWVLPARPGPSCTGRTFGHSRSSQRCERCNSLGLTLGKDFKTRLLDQQWDDLQWVVSSISGR